MLFVRIPKTKVHLPRYRFSFEKSRFHDLFFLSFPFLFTYTFLSLLFPSSFSSSSSFFFFLSSLFSPFLSFSRLFLSLSLAVLFSRFCEKLLLFFIFFSLPRPPSRPVVAMLTRVRTPPSSRARLGRASGRVALCPFLTISSRAVHRDLWSRWLVAMLTARFFFHFHREQASATCGRGDWSRCSLLEITFFTASEPSRPVVAVTRSRYSLVQFFNFHFFIFFTIQSGPLEIIK
ncbi:hypothetical protein ACOSQ4_005332 [Xanthoceras sorbifolium]